MENMEPQETPNEQAIVTQEGEVVSQEEAITIEPTPDNLVPHIKEELEKGERIQDIYRQFVKSDKFDTDALSEKLIMEIFKDSYDSVLEGQ
jgi:hypothetical protein